ncbi:MAG: hypothetical protein ACE5RP_00030 [Nitrosopumilus sp.]
MYQNLQEHRIVRSATHLFVLDGVMFMKHRFSKSWGLLLDEEVSDRNYWVSKGKIPLGTIQPQYFYDLDDKGKPKIPEKEIVTMQMDSINISHAQRDAMNILLLGGSGDGKSLILKSIWYYLHNAGYYTCYIDPYKDNSGWAMQKWQDKDSMFIAPHQEPEGIRLQHFMPEWSARKYELFKHNFRIYSSRLYKITEQEMWESLGMTNKASTAVVRIINKYGENLSIGSLIGLLNEMYADQQITFPTLGNAEQVLINLKSYDVINDDLPELELMNEWKKGNSVVISYNNASKTFLTYDIGRLIRQSSRYVPELGNKIPVMFFFDDGSAYAGDFRSNNVMTNYALEEIKNIGNNYRGMGLYNTLAVQSLKIIDSGVAETYKKKLISPIFQSPDSLNDINIPRRAIQYIRDGRLIADKKKHLMQWLYITEDNDVIPLFPFTSPSNHFKPIYRPKGVE